MNILGVIGNPVAQSRSPEIFGQFFSNENLADWEYRLFELQGISQLPALLENTPGLRGFNVTIPYKTEILAFLQELDATAETVGAVNTVTVSKKNGNFHLKGYNSDVYGFEKSLKESFGFHHSAALILGTGGSSLAVAAVMKKNNIPFHFVSRQPDSGYTYSSLTKEIIADHSLIINTTPLGMGGNQGLCAEIPYKAITAEHCCFDLVYNPPKTEFLRRCESRGARIANGYDMLHYQAANSWEFFKQDSGLF